MSENTAPRILLVDDEEIVHDAGGLMYGDGANMNALLGIAKPGELGIDIMHYNLHKTFSTPHGGGGPGSGPVGVGEDLVDFLADEIDEFDRQIGNARIVPAAGGGAQ